MDTSAASNSPAVIVETELQFSLHELGRACRVEVVLLEALVHEGVLAPEGDSPAQWRFDGTTLRKARTAVRLMQDLELSTAAVALVLDLFDEVTALRLQLRRHGIAG